MKSYLMCLPVLASAAVAVADKKENCFTVSSNNANFSEVFCVEAGETELEFLSKIQSFLDSKNLKTEDVVLTTWCEISD